MRAVPDAVLREFGLVGSRQVPIVVGLINSTFRVDAKDRSVVVQKLHPTFSASVNYDIDAITTHLSERGMVTPRIVRTVRGAPFFEHEGVWRALTLVEGRTVERVEGPEMAFVAGKLVGEFHRALHGFEHEFKFTREHVHDTRFVLSNYQAALESGRPTYGAEAFGDELLGTDVMVRFLFPQRIVHGDLKISNVIFTNELDQARALIDLDTMRYGTAAIDLGDALRSWSNANREGDDDSACDPLIVEAALRGYVDGAPGLLGDAEGVSIIDALHTITVELAARFATDMVDDSYFGWDSTKYESRRAHNEARVRSQLRLASSIRAQRDDLRALALSIFSPSSR